jgi:transposase
MLTVETIGRIRREHFIKGKTIREISRDLKVSRNTVRKVLRSGETSFEYERDVQPRPKLGRWTAELDELLEGNTTRPFREQLTLIRIFEELRGRGYDGGYDAVRRYARRWAKERGQSTAAAYVPLSFAPGEAYQFDWSHEVVLLSGVTVIVKAAHVRLCHSRMLFVRAYPRETQEMVFDAHDRAFALFKGACGRGIYDNMKTAVETIFVGKQRLYNRRFLQMCSHYLVDPVACTPASGWEKGQVENQVGLVRQRFFTPRLRFKNLDELNAWLLDKCIAYAKVHPHPELTEQTIWEVFEAERPKLVPYAGRFDGFHAVPASVSKTCLVRFDNNKYSVTASAVGRPVEVHAYADRIVIPRTGVSSPSIPVHSAAATRFMTPGTTCRCSPASPAPCATAHPSRTGYCRRRWSACGANSPVPTMAIGRWSTSSPRCSPMDCRRSRPRAPKRSPTASTPPMSSSTSLPVSVILGRQPPSSRRPR